MESKSVLTGSLNFISLADLFQILGGNNSTGTLRLSSQYTSNPGIIYFVDGNPSNANLGSLQGVKAVYALFGWTEGSFEFREEKVHAGQIIKQSRMQIVLDALRMLDDGMIERVGPPSFNDTPGGKEGGVRIIRRPIVDYMSIISEEEVPDGTDIVKEKGHGKWIWIILEGNAKVNRETAVGPVTVATLGQGSFVGMPTSFLYREYVRSATVKASGKVRLGLLDSDLLYEEYTSLSSEFKRLLVSLSKRLALITDRVVDLVSGKSDTDDWLDNKEILIKRGSRKVEAFTILEGETCLIGHTPKGSLPLMRLGKQDFIGALPFLDLGHEPYSASVLASKDLKLEPIDHQGLKDEYARVSGTFRSLIDHVSTCVSVTTRLAADYYKTG